MNGRIYCCFCFDDGGGGGGMVCEALHCVYRRNKKTCILLMRFLYGGFRLSSARFTLHLPFSLLALSGFAWLCVRKALKEILFLFLLQESQTVVWWNVVEIKKAVKYMNVYNAPLFRQLYVSNIYLHVAFIQVKIEDWNNFVWGFTVGRSEIRRRCSLHSPEEIGPHSKQGEKARVEIPAEKSLQSELSSSRILVCN